MAIRKDYASKNAIKELYKKKYELDKDFSFRVPNLKTDLDAYLHRLLNAVEEAFETGKVVRVKGHQLKFRRGYEKKGEENSDD